MLDISHIKLEKAASGWRVTITADASIGDSRQPINVVVPWDQADDDFKRAVDAVVGGSKVLIKALVIKFANTLE
jgi:serine protease inhibitor ecotin